MEWNFYGTFWFRFLTELSFSLLFLLCPMYLRYFCQCFSSFQHINTYIFFAKGRSRFINYNFIVVLLFRLLFFRFPLSVIFTCFSFLCSLFVLAIIYWWTPFLLFILSYPRDWYVYFSDNFLLEMTKINFVWTFENFSVQSVIIIIIRCYSMAGCCQGAWSLLSLLLT